MNKMKYTHPLLIGFLFASSIQTVQLNHYHTFTGRSAEIGVSNSILAAYAQPEIMPTVEKNLSRLGDYAGRARTWVHNHQLTALETWKHLRVSERLSDASRQAVKVAQQHPYATAATVVALCGMAGVVFKNQFDTWQQARAKAQETEKQLKKLMNRKQYVIKSVEGDKIKGYTPAYVDRDQVWAISRIAVMESSGRFEDRLSVAQELLRDIDVWSYDADQKERWRNYLTYRWAEFREQLDRNKKREKKRQGAGSEEQDFLAETAAQAALADSLSHGVSPSPSASPSCFRSAANSFPASLERSNNNQFPFNIDTTTEHGLKFYEAFKVASNSLDRTERFAALHTMRIEGDLLPWGDRDEVNRALVGIRRQFAESKIVQETREEIEQE